jgi:dihydrofolate reductase
VGSGALVRSLVREELLDELSLMVHPIVLGRGWNYLGIVYR